MPKALKRGILHLCISKFENMIADFVLRCQNLLSQTTPEIMYFHAGEKYILTNNMYIIAFDLTKY